MEKRRKRKLKNTHLLGIGGVLLLALLLVLYFVYTPKMQLKGKNVEEVNLKGRYQEKGVQAIYQGKDVSKKVKIKGKVNAKKKGVYQITYTVGEGIFTTQVTRTVIVKDMEKPKIILEGEKELHLCKKGSFKELGYHATDNIDGDLTKKVKVKKEKEKITYTVKDKEGNTTTLVRKLFYDDIEAPKIELTGGENVTVFLNEGYQELGYSAVDNCDGDITKDVKVTGNVDTSELGSYELAYEVQDSEGNKSEAKRTVRVIEHGKNGTIYLTFDDGPKQGTTDVILDILKEEGVKATFFVTNGGPDELILREKEEGHTVALHTASHNYQTVYSSVDGYFNDLQIVHDRVLRITGQDARIIRFPGGSSNTISRRYMPGIMSILTKEVLARGYRYYDWNLSSGDAGETNQASGVYQNVVSNLSKNRVNMVLMHDIKPYTRDALRDIIRYGKNNGYTFEAIGDATEMVMQRVNN